MSLSDVEVARRASVVRAIWMARQRKASLVVLTDTDAEVARRLTRKVCTCTVRKEAHLHVGAPP